MTGVRANKYLRSLVPAIGCLAVVAVVLKGALGAPHELARAAGLLSHPAIAWIALAVACEVVSFAAYSVGLRRVIRATGHRLSARWLAALSVAAQSLNNFVPGGYVAANVLNFSELRRRSLGAPAAAWALLVASALYIGVLAALTVIVFELSGTPAPGGNAVRIGAAVVMALLALGGLVALLLARRGRRSRRASAVLARFSEIRISRRGVVAVGGWFAVCWAADAACLAAAFLAVGAPPPWASLLPAYCAAQLMSFVPLTPGGLGLVEGSLAMSLVAGGGAPPHVVAAVLLYRAISYWGTLPAGAVGYLLLRRTRRTCPEPAEALPLASPEWSAQPVSAAQSSA